MEEIKSSFTSASMFPYKLFGNEILDSENRIIPVHIQVIPTNICNLSCNFCSCKDRDKNTEIDYSDLCDLIFYSYKLGTKSITITGGGEPLLHPKINEFIEYIREFRIKIGLVTNGTKLSNLTKHNNISWCRISSSDEITLPFDEIESAIRVNPNTDWAFSHVVTKSPNYEIIRQIIEFANKNNFTHVRLVPDLYNTDDIDMKEIKSNLNSIDDSKVIYQERNNSTKGTNKCFISLLKPVISPEGIFPCCGTQYALINSKRLMVNSMKMGDISKLTEIIKEQKYFDGSNCDVCYYSLYNEALDKILNKPKHVEFV